MLLELTIKVDYLSHWGLWEGARELIQNAKDAEVELGAEMLVEYVKDTQTLRITNTGTVLPHEALLLGHSTKAGNSDLIGKFGEGLKIGILALVRAGYKVKIRSGSEVWLPEIVDSKKFKAKVLAFDIKEGRQEEQRVRVEVAGIPEKEWDELKERFLFLKKENKRDVSQTVTTSYGDLLLQPSMLGRLYVKGIFVELDTSLMYGYNLIDADLDRDRRMLERYNRNSKLHYIWREALSKRPDLIKPFSVLLEKGAADVDGMSKWNASDIPSNAVDELTKEFIKLHGQTALPVKTMAESQDLEHLGRKGIVLPEKLIMLLSRNLGTVDDVKNKLKEEVIQRFSWHELTSTERTNLTDACRLVTASLARLDKNSTPVTLDIVDVVKFRDTTFLGMYKDWRIMVAHQHLADREETLATIVHETAHRAGGDGEHTHVATIENIWKGIVACLREKE